MFRVKRQIFAVPAFLLFTAIAFNGQIANSDLSLEGLPSDEKKSFTERNNLIHYGDLVEVDVVGSTEFDWRGEVTPEGTLGGLKFTDEPVVGLCRKGADVAAEIKKYYSRFLTDPTIRVEILDRSKRPLAILLGAVKQQQRFQLLRDVRLTELIVLAGGIAENANGGIEIRRQPAAACVGLTDQESVDSEGAVLRPAVRRETEFRLIKISDILRGEPEADILIHYGDLITVKSALPVYVIGNVNRPGKIAMTPGLTVGRAIDTSGGISEDTDSVVIRIFRRNSGRTEVIELSNEAGNDVSGREFEVREYDIVEVFGGRGSQLDYPPVLQNEKREDLQVSKLPIRIIK